MKKFGAAALLATVILGAGAAAPASAAPLSGSTGGSIVKPLIGNWPSP